VSCTINNNVLQKLYSSVRGELCCWLVFGTSRHDVGSISGQSYQCMINENNSSPVTWRNNFRFVLRCNNIPIFLFGNGRSADRTVTTRILRNRFTRTPSRFHTELYVAITLYYIYIYIFPILLSLYFPWFLLSCDRG